VSVFGCSNHRSYVYNRYPITTITYVSAPSSHYLVPSCQRLNNMPPLSCIIYMYTHTATHFAITPPFKKIVKHRDIVKVQRERSDGRRVIFSLFFLQEVLHSKSHVILSLLPYEIQILILINPCILYKYIFCHIPSPSIHHHLFLFI
jgi:hypothetical protein